MTSAAATAVVKSAGEARPPGVTPELAFSPDEESSDENVPPWSRASGVGCAVLRQMRQLSLGQEGEKSFLLVLPQACGRIS